MSPVYLAPKAIRHFMSCKFSSKAILVCLYWPSSTFWPLLFKKGGEFQDFIKDVIIIKETARYIKLGNYKGSIIGSESFKGEFIAFQLIK